MKSHSNKKETFNVLDGKTWTRYSISMWDVVKTHEEMSLQHPAMFPIELCKRIIEIYTRSGDTVLDPFAGSGTALAVAKRLNRQYIGIEISPHYCKMINRRLKNLHLQKMLFNGIKSS